MKLREVRRVVNGTEAKMERMRETSMRCVLGWGLFDGDRAELVIRLAAGRAV